MASFNGRAGLPEVTEEEEEVPISGSGSRLGGAGDGEGEGKAESVSLGFDEDPPDREGGLRARAGREEGYCHPPSLH